jgi:hypothetical protein
VPQFEVYDRKNSPAGRRRGETVTVNCRGYLSFSPDAYARLGSPQAVRYLIDKEERLIGFQPCKPREANAHLVSTGTRIASAVTLLKYMGVSHAEGRRYDLHCEDGLPPYIDLKEPGVPVTSNRRKVKGA